MSCLGRTLLARGHRVTHFQPRDSEAAVLASGLEYFPIAEKECPPGTMARIFAEQGERQGLAAMRSVIDWFIQEAQAVAKEAPAAIQSAGIDLLLVDQTTPTAATIAEHLGLPLVLVSNAIVLNREPAIPPFYTPWPYSTHPLAQLRNRLAYSAVNRIAKPYVDALNNQRAECGLAHIPLSSNGHFTYATAHISQQPACFDFPRVALPANFHYTGPFHDARVRPPVPFPWDRLTGRPLIYASMGTLQNRLAHVFRTIAESCDGLNCDLVISLGGGAATEQIGALPGNPIVVPFAPQLDLLARAALTITHAGLNTALETLAHGVPAVAIPVGNDQPGVAARLKWCGAGEFVPLRRLTPSRLRKLVQRVLTDPAYRTRARELQRQIQTAGGVTRAADIVEQAIKKND